jgi:hypothetical protein
MNAGDFHIRSIRNKITGSGLVVCRDCVPEKTEAFGVRCELVVCLANASAAAEQGGGKRKKEDFFHYWVVSVYELSGFMRTLENSPNFLGGATLIFKAGKSFSRGIRSA